LQKSGGESSLNAMTKLDEIFSAKSVENEGIVRRSKHDIE